MGCDSSPAAEVTVLVAAAVADSLQVFQGMDGKRGENETKNREQGRGDGGGGGGGLGGGTGGGRNWEGRLSCRKAMVNYVPGKKKTGL